MPDPISRSGTDGPAILFVDDDLANLKVLEVHLRSDFKVLTAQNGTDALALLDSKEFDVALVVADQRMAGMTGVELLTIVRERYPDIGRMLITAFADLDPIILAINQGQISGYIRKPWNPTDIRLLLRGGLTRVLLERRLHHAELELLSAERDAVLGFIGAGVGHELNQPASVLRMNLEVMQDTVDGLLGGDLEGAVDELRASLSDCLEAVETLSLLSHDLRVIGTNQRRRAAVAPTDLNAAVQRALRFTEAHLRQRAGVNVSLDDVPKVRADEAGLTQMVVNLFGHALQYLDDMSLDRPVEFSVQSRVESGRVVLRVRDDGPGIPASDLQRVFDPVLVEPREHGGSRVGLALAKRTADDWDGELLVNSAVDVGTEYVLRLLPAPASLSVVGDESHAESIASQPRVLVIDDETSVLRAVQRILRGTYEVDVAASGSEALAKLLETDYDAVLCDLQMPSPDGTEVYARLVRDKPALVPKFAFMTGGALSGRVAAFMDEVERNGVRILDKPFNHRQIRQVVSRLVAKDD